MPQQHLDKVPTGYMRKSKGWLTPEKTPQQSAVNSIRKQNTELKDRLAQLEAAVEAFTAKKGKK
jgi:predicted  nucleic acid-binding Zn-ribbon protein